MLSITRSVSKGGLYDKLCMLISLRFYLDVKMSPREVQMLMSSFLDCPLGLIYPSSGAGSTTRSHGGLDMARGISF